MWNESEVTYRSVKESLERCANLFDSLVWPLPGPPHVRIIK